MSFKLSDPVIAIRNFLFDWIITVFCRPKNRQNGKASILFIRLDAIGDFILWLDAAAELRRIYPPDRYILVLFGNALWTELALKSHYFDEVISVERKRLGHDFRYRIKMWRLLRNRAWAAVINPTFSRHFPYDDAAVRMSGARERIGSRGDLSNQNAWQKRISDRRYTRLIPLSDEPIMELERNAEFIRCLGLPHFRAGLPELVIDDEISLNYVARSYYVVVPSASDPIKQWPVDNFAALVKRIWKESGLKAVICGAPGDEELGLQLKQLALADGADIEVRTGTTSLTEFAAIIKGANFVIANDSSAIHIAAAVGTTSFCIVSGVHYGRFVPYRLERSTSRPLPVTIAHRMACYQCNMKCCFNVQEGQPVPCLERIGVDDVWSRICTMFEKIDSESTPADPKALKQ